MDGMLRLRIASLLQTEDGIISLHVREVNFNFNLDSSFQGFQATFVSSPEVIFCNSK